MLHFWSRFFNSLEEFKTKFASLDTQQQVEELHRLLQPHMLRRTKRDVNLRIPEKKELIVRVDLTKLQREIYRSILVKNFEALSGKRAAAGGARVLFGGRRVRPLNIVMELKKCAIIHTYSTTLRSLVQILKVGLSIW